MVGRLYRPSQVRDWLSLPTPTGNVGPPSLAAILIRSAPFTMVKFSIFSFLMGLTVYLGFVWTRELDTTAGRNDSRNVFTTYTVGAGFCVLFFILVFSSKAVENAYLSKWGGAYRAGPRVGGTAGLGIPLRETGGQGQSSPSGSSGGGDNLGAALQAVALAHTQSAEADRRLAEVYGRMVSSS